MLYAFIDESEHQDKYFILTALIVRDENLDNLNQGLANLLAQYATTTGTPEHGELHGYDLMQQKGDWAGFPLRLTSSLYLKALEIINKQCETLYVETIDREEQRKRYKTVFNHRSLAIGFILERVNEFALRHREEVLTYLDDHYTAPAGRKEFIAYKATGTFGYKSSRLEAIRELDFFDSRSMFGLQAADLCCYAYQRNLCARKSHPKTVKLQEKMWTSLADIRSNGRVRIWP